MSAFYAVFLVLDKNNYHKNIFLSRNYHRESLCILALRLYDKMIIFILVIDNKIKVINNINKRGLLNFLTGSTALPVLYEACRFDNQLIIKNFIIKIFIGSGISILLPMIEQNNPLTRVKNEPKINYQGKTNLGITLIKGEQNTRYGFKSRSEHYEKPLYIGVRGLFYLSRATFVALFQPFLSIKA